MSVQERAIAATIAMVLTVSCGAVAVRTQRTAERTSLRVASQTLLAPTTLTTAAPTTQPPPLAGTTLDTTTTSRPRTIDVPAPATTPTTAWTPGSYPLDDVPPGQMTPPHATSPFDGLSTPLTVTPTADPLTVDATVELVSPLPLAIMTFGLCWGDTPICGTVIVDGPTLSCPHLSADGDGYRYEARVSHTYPQPGTYRVSASVVLAPACDAPGALTLITGDFTDITI